MMIFSSDLVLISTKPPSKRHEKIPVTFFTGAEQNYDGENIELHITLFALTSYYTNVHLNISSITEIPLHS